MAVCAKKTRQNRKLAPVLSNRSRTGAAPGAAALELAARRLYGRPPPGHFPGKSQPSQRQARKAVRTIYKITPASAWREAERQGVYKGSSDDLRDGYIHFSTASQVAETARKHYFGQTGLFLIAVDADALGDALRWEPSRNDELFPHLYGELDLGAVTDILDMRARSDGYHEIPELLP
jgi:uncharacterized protein (DUF952 family)